MNNTNNDNLLFQLNSQSLRGALQKKDFSSWLKSKSSAFSSTFILWLWGHMRNSCRSDSRDICGVHKENDGFSALFVSFPFSFRFFRAIESDGKFYCL